MKKKIYILLFFIINYFFINNSFGDGNGPFGIKKVNDSIIGDKNHDIFISIKGLLNYFLSFTAFISITMIIKSGFGIMISGNDDEKLKNGKKTLLFALIGLFTILIAWTIVNSTLTSLEEINKN